MLLTALRRREAHLIGGVWYMAIQRMGHTELNIIPLQYYFPFFMPSFDTD